MEHGYTNDTERSGSLVWKQYRGPFVRQRAEAEQSALRRLGRLLPVPRLVAATARSSGFEFVAGDHGQDLIDAGRAPAVLRACGETLRQIQDLDVGHLRRGARGVIVHGDFGPNNLLLDPENMRVTAILDWEFCHAGDPIEDLAWCEWIARRHHPDHVDALPQLFAGYGSEPPWSLRLEAMLLKCRKLEEFCRAWVDDGAGVRQWRKNRKITATWTA